VGDCWSWRGDLFVWEVELVEECIVLLYNISLHDNMEYTWNMYYVKEAYKLISNFEDLADSPL